MTVFRIALLLLLFSFSACSSMQSGPESSGCPYMAKLQEKCDDGCKKSCDKLTSMKEGKGCKGYCKEDCCADCPCCAKKSSCGKGKSCGAGCESSKCAAKKGSCSKKDCSSCSDGSSCSGAE